MLSTPHSCQCVGATTATRVRLLHQVSTTQTTEIATMVCSSSGDGKTPPAPEQQSCIQPKTDTLPHTNNTQVLLCACPADSKQRHWKRAHTLNTHTRHAATDCQQTGKVMHAQTHARTLKKGRATGVALCRHAQHSTAHQMASVAGPVVVSVWQREKQLLMLPLKTSGGSCSTRTAADQPLSPAATSPACDL